MWFWWLLVPGFSTCGRCWRLEGPGRLLVFPTPLCSVRTSHCLTVIRLVEKVVFTTPHYYLQRAHQNTLENIPHFLAILLLSGLYFPKYAAGKLSVHFASVWTVFSLGCSSLSMLQLGYPNVLLLSGLHFPSFLFLCWLFLHYPHILLLSGLCFIFCI